MSVNLHKFENLNANSTATVSDVFSLASHREFAANSVAVSGANTAHIFTLQVLMDDDQHPQSSSNWVDTGLTLSQLDEETWGEGIDDIVRAAKWARWKCSTAEGGASVITINQMMKG